MTYRTMYDSDNIDAVPDDAEIIAFYNDGEPGTATVEQLQRFSGRILVPITRAYGVKSKVGDIETGALTLDQAIQMLDSGDIDTLYFSMSRWTSMEIPNALGIRTPFKWVADYPGTLTPPADISPFDAWQYASPSQGVPGHYDLSVVSDTWPVKGTVVASPVEPVVHADYTDTPLEDATGKILLNAPIVDAVAIGESQGYMVAADGGVFTYGGAPFHGSVGNVQLNAAVCAIVANGTQGYTLIAQDGGTFMFGPNPPHVPAL